MDKETAERLTTLEVKMETLETEHASWNSLIRSTVLKTISWLLGTCAIGIAFGWHLPENVRKAIADWMSK